MEEERKKVNQKKKKLNARKDMQKSQLENETELQSLKKGTKNIAFKKKGNLQERHAKQAEQGLDVVPSPAHVWVPCSAWSNS